MISSPHRTWVGSFGVACTVVALVTCNITRAQTSLDGLVSKALARAGKNRAQLEQALQQISGERKRGLQFLVAHMPERDLTTLSSSYLLQHVNGAYETRNSTTWARRIPEPVFFNNVLPYCNINESRELWRAQLHKKFFSLVKDAKSTSEVATILNRKIFPALKVKYSTKRKRADQAPSQTMQSGLASCTGLSILLIDACRAVGAPARFVGTPLWSDGSGNHSWVEVWDQDGWHFTGAAEPSGDKLDKAWFLGRASKAKRDHRLHAIYAVSFRPTGQSFPLVWDRRIDYVHAINVTDRYTSRAEKLPPGAVRAMFLAFDGRQRCCANLTIRDGAGKQVFAGKTNDERFDTNDHRTVPLRKGQSYQVELESDGKKATQTIKVESADQLFRFNLNDTSSPKTDSPKTDTASKKSVDATADDGAFAQQLQRWRKKVQAGQPIKTADSRWLDQPLTAVQATTMRELLWESLRLRSVATRQAELNDKMIELGDKQMPFEYKVCGKRPEAGHSLYISLHGGGQTRKQVNDQQWRNQQRLYEPSEGIYIAPRAPTDTWNLWHQGHIDPMFDRLIQNFVITKQANPNRVYLLGYSAGGDGVYQVAPRFADRLAAAAMMAGHPNESQPLGLRNIGFAIFMGGRDAAYKRNQIAREWGNKLDELEKQDPGGYRHKTTIYPNDGHWMKRKDRVALPWMAKFTRTPFPKKIAWRQDNVTHRRFYWLQVKSPARGDEWTVACQQQTINVINYSIQSKEPELTLCLSDALLNLDQPVKVMNNGKQLFDGKVTRTMRTLESSLQQRIDPAMMYSAKLTIKLPRK